MSTVTEHSIYHNEESRSPMWEPQFEHIDWNDIVDAEEEGDFEKLKSLRKKSMELKRSKNCPSPVATNVGHATPVTTPNFCLSEMHPFLECGEYPPVNPQTVQPSSFEVTSPNGMSYAQALAPRLTKRTMSDRTGLSPVDFLPKRSALSNVVTTPININQTDVDKLECNLDSPMVKITPKANAMDIGITPDNDSWSNKVAVVVQRRLFPPSKENAGSASPTQEAGSVNRSRSSSVSSNLGQVMLTDHQLLQRQKQIEFGKNTLGYQRYVQTIPKWQRTREDPWTPDKNKQCSTRGWQGKIRVWRRALHSYDPPNQGGTSLFTAEEAALCDMDIPCRQEK